MGSNDLNSHILDLSLSSLKKIPTLDDAYQYRTLILDGNQLKTLENIDLFSNIEKLSLHENQILRMHAVSRLFFLRDLNLSFNSIFKIEGLKELTHLKYLNLAGNKLKDIEHLDGNIGLECLNLSENNIDLISNISFLGCLKELYLHSNRLIHLGQCDKFLPSSLETLTLAKNLIIDLNEICTLSGLKNLENLTINDNPCVEMNIFTDGFDHRPFVLNWCSSLKSIDAILVGPLESLKAEWLYSQGRGRQFRIGEQENLTKYLCSVCPLLGKAPENENERKLRLILSKAQLHQRQLQEEISENSDKSSVDTTSHATHNRVLHLEKQLVSPDFMSNSFPGNSSSVSTISGSIKTFTSPQCFKMITSLIDERRGDSTNSRSLKSINKGSSSKCTNGGPLTAASKMVPVPENLMSPDVCPSLTQPAKESPLNMPQKIMNSTLFQHSKDATDSCNSNIILSEKQGDLNSLNQILCESNNVQLKDENADYIIAEKLETIKYKAAQRNESQKENNLASVANESQLSKSSAIKIQKLWRGFVTRKKHKYFAKNIIKHRTQEYIRKLAIDIEATNVQLRNERKVQQLQLQAINALWRNVSNIKNTSALHESISDCSLNNIRSVAFDTCSAAAVSDLTQTCSLLANQVKRLQSSISDMFDCITIFCSIITDNSRKDLGLEGKHITLGTQTEEVSDNSYRSENTSSWPVKIRPSTLTLNPDESGSSKLPTISPEQHEVKCSTLDIPAWEQVASDNKME